MIGLPTQVSKSLFTPLLPLDSLDAKYDKALEAGHRKWIEDLTGLPIGDNFQVHLHFLLVLCHSHVPAHLAQSKFIQGHQRLIHACANFCNANLCTYSYYYFSRQASSLELYSAS